MMNIRSILRTIRRSENNSTGVMPVLFFKKRKESKLKNMNSILKNNKKKKIVAEKLSSMDSSVEEYIDWSFDKLLETNIDNVFKNKNKELDADYILNKENNIMLGISGSGKTYKTVKELTKAEDMNFIFNLSASNHKDVFNETKDLYKDKGYNVLVMTLNNDDKYRKIFAHNNIVSFNIFDYINSDEDINGIVDQLIYSLESKRKLFLIMNDLSDADYPYKTTKNERTLIDLVFKIGIYNDGFTDKQKLEVIENIFKELSENPDKLDKYFKDYLKTINKNPQLKLRFEEIKDNYNNSISSEEFSFLSSLVKKLREMMDPVDNALNLSDFLSKKTILYIIGYRWSKEQEFVSRIINQIILDFFSTNKELSHKHTKIVLEEFNQLLFDYSNLYEFLKLNNRNSSIHINTQRLSDIPAETLSLFDNYTVTASFRGVEDMNRLLHIFRSRTDPKNWSMMNSYYPGLLDSIEHFPVGGWLTFNNDTGLAFYKDIILKSEPYL